MHDLRAIREDPVGFDTGLARRGLDPAATRILDIDESRRQVATRLQEAQARRNEASRAFGAKTWQQAELVAKHLQLDVSGPLSPGQDAELEALQRLKEKIRAEVVDIKEALPELAAEERACAQSLQDELAALPNLPAEDVPDGADETANVEVARWGTPRDFAFTPLEHADLGPPLGMDFETAAAMSGARFTFLRGQMARLHRALGQFMLDFQTRQRGYVECAPPLLVREEAAFGTGQLPKFADDLFRTTDGRWLIPTAEVSLTNSVREQILGDLFHPIRLTALTPCFRSEAGAAGKDTRGFIRQHQFEKVELVTICAPEQAAAEHAHMLESAQMVLEALGLPYRTMLLCAGDMGATARKTYDLEVWLPGQGAYREISSVSWCGDYQARRMNTRYRPAGAKGTTFVHTLNGSGLAVGRTLVAVLENGQQADGSVLVPEPLAPYMGGIDKLEPISPSRAS
jgi:seryl-tRNA synthetase